MIRLILLGLLLSLTAHAAGVKDYDLTAGNNTTINGISIAEGMAPGNVNNAMRQQMADTREFYETGGFIDFGHTPTQTASTTFTVTGDVTSYYTVSRRIRVTDATTFYGDVISSTFSSPNTTVTVATDDGDSLSGSLSAVALGFLDPTNYPLASVGISGTGTMFSQDADSVAITGGNIDGTVVGATTAAAATFTTVAVNTTLTTAALTLSETVTAITTDGTLSADSDNNIPTEKAVKAYVDSGSSSSGVVQSLISTTVTYTNTASNIPVDDTIPQSGEGAQFISQAITPTSASNTIRVTVFANMTSSSSSHANVSLFKDAGANALATMYDHVVNANLMTPISIVYEEAAGSTAARTYKGFFGASAGTAYLNGNSSNRLGGGVATSGIIVEEISQ